MILVTALAAALLVTGAPEAPIPDDRTERVDVGYRELAGNRPEAAIARIEANHSLPANDPARLINLAAAHLMLERKTEARRMLTAAIASPDRFDLQLADGSWMDSRQAARMALARLHGGASFAVR